MCPLWALLMLCLHFGHLCNAFYVGHSITVEYGGSALLLCDGSAFLEDNGTVHWETIGTDVAYLRGGEQKIGTHFKGRIQLPPEEEISKGNWSVVITQTKLRDSSIYECIWQERRTLSTVWLTVQEPSVERSITVHSGRWVDLLCYIESSRIPSDHVVVWWTKDGVNVISSQDGSISLRKDIESISDEEFLLQMLVTPTDGGKYECWYKTRHGHPESITLTVLDEIVEAVSEYDETTTLMWYEWVNSSSWIPFTEEEEEEEEEVEVTTEPPVHILPVLLTDPTLPTEVTTELQPMEAFEETVTSYLYEGTPETSSFQWADLPWVRIGLIGGVLLVTSVVLSVLGALSKI